MSNNCKICDNIVISDAVTFTGGNLVIDIPARNYGDGCKYCLVIAQTIPDTTTISAPVFITIGGDAATLYPLTTPCCSQATACAMRTRTRYPLRVSTTATGGSFRLLNHLPCVGGNRLESIPAPAATGGDGA